MFDNFATQSLQSSKAQQISSPDCNAGSVHIPLDETHPERFEAAVRAQEESLQSESQTLYVMCRRGNNSQRAAILLKEKFGLDCVDLEGGTQEYAAFEPSFPVL